MQTCTVAARLNCSRVAVLHYFFASFQKDEDILIRISRSLKTIQCLRSYCNCTQTIYFCLFLRVARMELGKKFVSLKNKSPKMYYVCSPC